MKIACGILYKKLQRVMQSQITGLNLAFEERNPEEEKKRMSRVRNCVPL